MKQPAITALIFLIISTAGVLSASVAGSDLLTQLLQQLQDSQTAADSAATGADADGDASPLYAGCDIRADDMDISGSINLRQQTDGTLDIFVNVTGFDGSNDYFVHGLHVHEFGDFSDKCTSFGTHYNPYGNNHGAKQDPPTQRHLGDWGNIEEDGNGNILLITHDYLAKLEGVNTIAGRGIVIHEHGDDLGRGDSEDSLTTGNSGTRLGCCVIYYNEGLVWQNM